MNTDEQRVKGCDEKWMEGTRCLEKAMGFSFLEEDRNTNIIDFNQQAAIQISTCMWRWSARIELANGVSSQMQLF